MAKTVPLSILCFVLHLSSGWTILQVNGEEKTWCVAKASSDETSLQDNLHYACTQVDCSVINAGGSCFEPNLLISHASVAMNLYYQSRGRNVWNCDFTHSGLITISDPSYGTCSYAYGS